MCHREHFFELETPVTQGGLKPSMYLSMTQPSCVHLWSAGFQARTSTLVFCGTED